MNVLRNETLEHFPSTTFGLHCHNDWGLAVWNSISMAMQSGVGLVQQGTINGIGDERTGNADLCSITPSLALHCGCTTMSCKENLENITSLLPFLDETLHRTPDRLAPYVGALGICCVEHKDSSSFDFDRIDILTNQLIVKDAKMKKRREKSKDISRPC